MNENMRDAASLLIQAYNWKVFARKDDGTFELSDTHFSGEELEKEVIHAMLNFDPPKGFETPLYSDRHKENKDTSPKFIWPCGEDGEPLEDQKALDTLEEVSEIVDSLSIMKSVSYYRRSLDGEDFLETEEEIGPLEDASSHLVFLGDILPLKE